MRIKENPKEGFIAKLSGKKEILWCKFCGTKLKKKKSQIDQHLETEKHVSHKKRWENYHQVQEEVATSLSNRMKEDDSCLKREGRLLHESIRTYRFMTVDAFLSCGIPLNKLENVCAPPHVCDMPLFVHAGQAS